MARRVALALALLCLALLADNGEPATPRHDKDATAADGTEKGNGKNRQNTDSKVNQESPYKDSAPAINREHKIGGSLCTVQPLTNQTAVMYVLLDGDIGAGKLAGGNSL